MSAYVELASRVVLALVFGASAFSKVRSRQSFTAFTAALRAMRLVPGDRAPAVASAVAATECALTGLLIWPASLRIGFAVATLIMLCFTAVILVVRRRGVAASCACFGAAGAPFGLRHLVRNTFLLGLAVAGFAASSVSTSTSTVGAVTAGVVAGVVALLIIAMDDVAVLLRSTDDLR